MHITISSVVLLLFYMLSFCKEINSEECNEFVCGSVVSKCLLTQSCQCKLSNCHCCKDCLNCMGSLFLECCSCLDMCPPKENKTIKSMSPFSSIGDFEGVPELFDTLTADDDDDEEWTTVRFSSHIGLKQKFGDKLDYHTSLRKSTASINCTVVYLNSCESNKKCIQYCESMGANSYRWFYNGCCECVGHRCYNYGINEIRCLSCLDEENDENVDESEMNYGEDESNFDYGEDEFNYN